MRKIVLRLALGAGLVAGFGACSDELVDPQLRDAPERISANYTTITEYRDYECYSEQGGHLWLSRETWARDAYTYEDNTVSYGEPYLVSFSSQDTGPTAGAGYLQCDYYPGYWV
jgi:hypothetical protein